MSTVRCHFCQIWHLFSWAFNRKFLLVLLRSITNYIYIPWKILKTMRYCLNYSGRRFCPLKIKITQFPNGFCLNLLSTVFSFPVIRPTLLELPMSCHLVSHWYGPNLCLCSLSILFVYLCQFLPHPWWQKFMFLTFNHVVFWNL